MKTYNKAQAQFINNFIASFGTLSKLKASDAKGVGMTKEELAKAIAQVRQIQKERGNLAYSKKTTPSLELQLRKRLCETLTKRLVSGFSYRQPASNWVNVDNSVWVSLSLTEKIRTGFDAVTGRAITEVIKTVSRLEVGETVIRHDKHWNWKANQTSHNLILNPIDDFTTVGGLLTIFRKADRNLPAVPCKWYEQSRGFEVKEVRGFLVGDYHVEAESAEKALELVARRRKVQVNALAKRKALEEKADDLKLTANLVNKKFGFCMAGIRSFCEVNGIDPKASYTLKDLRNIVVNNRNINCGVYESYLKRLGISLNCK